MTRIFILLSFLIFSNIQSADSPGSIKEVYLGFNNLAKTEVEVEISEIIHDQIPFEFLLKETLCISQGQTGMSVLTAAQDSQKKTVSIWIKGGKKYGKTGMFLKLDLMRTETFTYDIVEEWVQYDETLPEAHLHLVEIKDTNRQ